MNQLLRTLRSDIRVYSFDVYDTSFVRNFARPVDLFFVLAERMLEHYYKQHFGQEEIVELARLRIMAETKARQASSKEEISLSEIYEYSQELSWWGIPTAAMMEEELNLERECIRPILATKQKIDALHNSGFRIIFISDMYLPQQAIRQMLLDHDLAHPNDPVYVSGEIGLTKQSGRLFEYVLAQEGIDPKQLWHHGDNPHSDVIVPAKMGIKTSFFQQSQLNRYENAILKQGHNYPWLYSRVAGVSRVARLTGNADIDSLEVSNLAASVVSPLLTCFVAWVMQDARKRGIERLYFISRDGQILLKIAHQLAEYRPGPECRYLYGSRQAWLLPSVFSCDRKSLDWLVVEGHSKAPRHLLKKLAIEPAEIKDVLSRYNADDHFLDEQLSGQGLERFWEVIEHPDVSSLILKKAASARKTALTYFCQEGLCSTAKWALVDVGWALRGQRAIKQILDGTEYRGEVRGYYLGLSRECLPISETGNYRAFLLQEPNTRGIDSAGEYLLNNTMLVEHLFMMADHETVIGYRNEADKVFPVFKRSPRNLSPEQFVQKFHKAILCYTEEIAKTGLLEDFIDELKEIVLGPVKKFLSNPTLQEAKSIAWIQTVVDQTHEEGQHRSLARRLNLKDIWYIGRYYIARRIRRVVTKDFIPRYSWLEGSLVLSSLWIRIIFLPIRFVLWFKQHDGIRYIQSWWGRIIAKEVL